MEDIRKYRIFLYKRGIGYVKDFLCLEKTAKGIAKQLLNKFDGTLIADEGGFLKAMYGYCGP